MGQILKIGLVKMSSSSSCDIRELYQKDTYKKLS